MSVRAQAAAAVLSCLVPLLASGAFAQGQARASSGLLRAEFWTEAEPVPAVGDEWPVSADTARGRLLDEAAWVFGGMVWGFDFRYSPYDKTRGIEERFDLEPIHSLDAALLEAGKPSSGDGSYRDYVSFQVDPSLASLVASYGRQPWSDSQGIGRADIGGGVKARRQAYVDALRLAVRAYLQGLEPNKPRLVRGRVVLGAVPSLAVIEGFYTAQVRARVMVIEAVPYAVY
jgi:hypothetical protein